MKKLLFVALLFAGCQRWQYIDSENKYDNWFGGQYQKVVDEEAMTKKYFTIPDPSTVPKDVKSDLNNFLKVNPKFSNFSDFELYKEIKTNFSYNWIKGDWPEADQYGLIPTHPTAIIYKWIKSN